MAQSIFGGFTDYTGQSLEDILQDIENWIDYTVEMKLKMNGWIEQSKSSGYWDKIGFDFKQLVLYTVSYYNTILSDLKIVKRDGVNDALIDRDLSLLRSIGKKSAELNAEYGLTWHRSDGERWMDYGNPDFAVVEKMYQKGRDYFVTMQDAYNTTFRLEDYMQNGNGNNVTFKEKVSNSQIQIGTVNSAQTKIVNNSSFPYDEVMEVLSEINKYKVDMEEQLGEQAEEFSKTLAEVIDEVGAGVEPSEIVPEINLLKSFAMSVSSSLVASGVLELLKRIPL